MNLRTSAFVLAAFAAAACSGGGGNAPAPGPTPTIPGRGYGGAFAARVTFDVVVPALATGAASIRRATRAIPAPTPSPSGAPYISPAIKTLQITPVEVDGASLAVVQPPVTTNVACPTASKGCSSTVTVPAAAGATNRYFIQTFAAPPAAGAGSGLISEGFVDVVVPATGAATQSLGGATTLSLGGFVAALRLSPASLRLTAGTPATASVLVEALDAGGAVIIGNTRFANAVAVSTSDNNAFTLDGRATVTLADTSETRVSVRYSGAASGGTLVTAASTDGDGRAISATLEIAVAPAVVPTNSPTPFVPSPLSLYVQDVENDETIEYGNLDALVAKRAFTPTIRRVIGFSQGAVSGSTISCIGPIAVSNVNDTGGLYIDAAGNVVVQSNCVDGNNAFNLVTFGADATGVANAKIFSAIPQGFFNQPVGIAAVDGQGTSSLYVAFYGSAFPPLVTVVDGRSGSQGANYFASGCAPQLGPLAATADCNAPANVYSLSGALAADSRALYLGTQYAPGAVAPGPGTAPSLAQPNAVSVYPLSPTSLASPVPQVDISGLGTALGNGNGPPFAMAVEGSRLYVLSAPGSPAQLAGGSYFPGLSSCPPPSSNAPLNTLGAIPACQDGQPHQYLEAFDISRVLDITNLGTDVELTPIFVIGGDTVGRFGCLNFTTSTSLQLVAVKDGIVAIVNPTPKNPGCGSSFTLSAANAPANEIDLYDTRGLTGSHTDVAPVAVIPAPPAHGSFLGSYFGAAAFGPPGTKTGGTNLLLQRRDLPHTGRVSPNRFRARRPNAPSPFAHS